MSDLSHAEAVAEGIRTAIGRVVRRLRPESGMPNQQVTAVWWLERRGSMTASGLAAAERITPQSRSVILSALHDQGFVDRVPDPHDQRQILWSVTTRGRAVVVEERARRAQGLVTAIDEELTDKETARLRDAARPPNKIMDRSEDGGV